MQELALLSPRRKVNLRPRLTQQLSWHVTRVLEFTVRTLLQVAGLRAIREAGTSAPVTMRCRPAFSAAVARSCDETPQAYTESRKGCRSVPVDWHPGRSYRAGSVLILMRISKVMLLEVMTDSKSVCLEDASRPFLPLISGRSMGLDRVAGDESCNWHEGLNALVLFTCQTSQFYQQPYTI